MLENMATLFLPPSVQGCMQPLCISVTRLEVPYYKQVPLYVAKGIDLVTLLCSAGANFGKRLGQKWRRRKSKNELPS